MQYSLKELFDSGYQSDLNLKWFIENQEKLIQDYNNEYVAIDDGIIIEHHPDMDEFFNLLKRNTNRPYSALVQFITDRNIKVNKK